MSLMMACFFWVILISHEIISAQCYLFPFRRMLSERSDDVSSELIDGDAGEPLFLSPYISRGDIAEARRLARVQLAAAPSVRSYAGYITVDHAHDSNQFFWYFPSIQAQDTAPVLVWLQGGPGGSSLFGLFLENGPLIAQNGTFHFREHHWAQNHHVIYIDNPVGAGFSFTKDDAGYCTDETQIGEQLYSTVTQFFKLFPELQKNKFFLSGESYAGKYIPALAYTIHKKNPTADVKINLQGLAIGDGWCDPVHHYVYSEYLYQIGFVDWNQKAKIKEYEKETVNYIKDKQWENAHQSGTKVFDYLNNVDVYNYINKRRQNIFDQIKEYYALVQSSAVRKAIHVGNQPYDSDASVAALSKSLELDLMQSVAPWISELLDHYPVYTYNGQLDIIVAYPLTVNFLRNLNFTGAEEYKTATRHEWMVDGETAGYVKQAGRLTEILVRNAGHMVPADQPLWAWDMITRITHGIPFYDED